MPQALDVDWDEIRKAVVGGLGQRQAAQRYGVTYSTLAGRCAREGWFAHVHKAVSKRIKADLKHHASSVLNRAKREIESSITDWTAQTKTAAQAGLEVVKAGFKRDQVEAGDTLALARTLDAVDRVARRAMGIPETMSAQVVAGQVHHKHHHEHLMRICDDMPEGDETVVDAEVCAPTEDNNYCAKDSGNPEDKPVA